MCNKRITFLKYNSVIKNFHRFLAVIIPVFVMIFFSACEKMHLPEHQHESKLRGFPELESAIVSRDYRELLKWIDHDDKYVAALARRAVTKTEPDDIEEFVQLGLDFDSGEIWHMISLRPIGDEYVSGLIERFKNGEIQSDAVCQVFRQLGMLKIAEELSTMSEILQNSYHCSFAMGVILSRQIVNELTLREILNIAFTASDPQIRKNILYGLYRSTLNRPEPGSLLQEELAEFYRLTGLRYSPEEDEMLVRIIGKDVLGMVMMKYSDAELRENIQLSVELAANLVHFQGIELHSRITRRLLNHQNPHVIVQTLFTLTEVSPLQPDMLLYIENEILRRTRNHEVFIASLNLLVANGSDISRYRNRLDFTLAENPYLADRIFPLYRHILNHTDFMNIIRENIDMGGIRGYHAFISLIPVFVDFFEADGFIDEIRQLVLAQLDKGDRMVVHALERFLQNEYIIREDDFDLMYQHYLRFIDNREYAKAGVLTDVLRFYAPDHIDNLFEIPEKKMLSPDWVRLKQMGENPHWILETTRGTIEIRLDPLIAPFTVSSVDSLTRAGKYDGLPFHRVIANFVIQGGDIEMKGGFGGPGYRLPTEPTFETFGRGSVGVASSGTDTEGSQFFITLNPTPHLDGFYTRFGSVVRGMDVAERIQIGDRVIRARIAIR